MKASLTPAALAKAKAFAVVATALTAGGAGGMIALSQVSSNSDATQVVISADATTTPTADPSAAATPTATPTPSDTPAASPSAYALPSCPADVKNHGAYVSSVAHSAPKSSPGEHGSWVSQAARSDCGKSPSASDGQDSPEPEHTDAPETHSPKPVRTHASSHDSHKSDHGDH